MATTSLFVEIIVIGVLAELWFAVALLALNADSTVRSLMDAFVGLKDFMPVVTAILLAITYAVGWAINFAIERMFKYIFERGTRDRLFNGKVTDYRAARTLVLQHGSADLLRELLFDRHIIRIARSNVFNFTCLALALSLCVGRFNARTILPTVAASLGVAILSFAQWRTRYQGHYESIAMAADVIRTIAGSQSN